MMDQSELKYAIRVDERAFFIRFYCWLYEADKRKVNFCKLFWAYTFAAPALCIRGTIGVGRLTGKGAVLFWRGVKKLAGLVLYPVVSLADSAAHVRRERKKKAAEAAAARSAQMMREARQNEGKWTFNYATRQYSFMPPKLPPTPPKPAPTPAQKSETMQRVLNFVEHGGTIAVMKGRAAKEAAKPPLIAAGRTTVRVANRIGKIASTPAIGQGLLLAAAALSVAGVGLCVYLIAPQIPHVFTGVGEGFSAAASDTRAATGAAVREVTHSKISLWALLGVVSLIVLSCAIMGAAAIGLPFLIMKYVVEPVGKPIARSGELLGESIDRPLHGVERGFEGVGRGVERGAEKIGGGLQGFARVMYLGYRAVKSSTCPRIEIEKRPDPEKIAQMEQEVGL